MTLFLESTKLFELRRVGSKLFHSMIVERKKEFLKLCLILKQGMLSTFLVAHACVTFLVFCTNVITEVIPNSW